MSTYKMFCFLSFIALSMSCVEEINLRDEVDESFQSSLVVEATITDEIGFQTVLLSRAYPLGEEGPAEERNATVEVQDTNGNIFDFQETEAGTYRSNSQFAATPNVGYQLLLITSEGKEYRSAIKSMEYDSQIEELYVERDVNENEVEGVSIYVNSSDPIDSDRYYRYTYEETYKIIPPFYVPEDLIYTYEVVILPDGTPTSVVTYSIIPKEEEQQICYNTVNSNTIIIRDTSEFVDGADTDNFRVHFVGRDNYIISHRYSILVKQFTQSIEAYNYYRILKDFSDSENLLSETQPGFIEGNIEPISDENELVIGFFEVASVDARRVFFNYADLFPGEELPPWLNDCDIFAPPDGYNAVVPPDGRLLAALDAGHKYYQPNLDPVPISPMAVEGAYDLVFSNCGDCRVLGDNVIPEFWEE